MGREGGEGRWGGHSNQVTDLFRMIKLLLLLLLHLPSFSEVTEKRKLEKGRDVTRGGRRRDEGRVLGSGEMRGSLAR